MAKLKSKELAELIARAVDKHYAKNPPYPIITVEIAGEDIRNKAGRVCSESYMDKVASAFEEEELGTLIPVFGDEDDGDDEGELLLVIVERVYGEMPTVKL